MLRGVLAVVLLLLVLVPRSTAVGRFPVSTVAASFGIRGGERTDDTSIEATTTTTTGATCPEILEDKVVYRGWRTITQRKVKMRNGKIVDFDLVGVKTGGSAVLIFAWDTKTRTATLVREYMPASHKILWGMAAGLVEDKHNDDVATAARDELEEEAHLTGGRWILLSRLPSAMDKYAFTHIHAYLVLDPDKAVNPKPLDDEEEIEVVNGITIPEIMEWIENGEMNLVSGWGCMLAIHKLRELGEYP